MGHKTDKIIFFLALSFFIGGCAGRAVKIKPVKFDYRAVTAAYFNPDNPDPFPLTVQRGNNLYHSTTAAGNLLFYATTHNGNYDIWFRDLTSSIIVPVTHNPAPEYKPAISPDGKHLVYVSEEFESEGDLILKELDPAKMIAKILKEGEKNPDNEVKVLTNALAETPKRERIRDTDPFWSPDGRYIVFATERFSLGQMNLAIMDMKDYSVRQLTKKGGESPFWSSAGIVFVSYRDNEEGEIYLSNPSSYEETRITFNKNIEFSPSMSHDENYLYYSAITRDTNGDGKMNAEDRSVVMRMERKTGNSIQLTNEDYSAFDTRFSTFNGGSIIFSAALYNTINVYFIPLTGQIPKQENIEEQFLYIHKYLEKYSLDGVRLAIRSLKAYFQDDPYYKYYSPRAEFLKLKEAEKYGNIEYYKYVYEEIQKSKNPLAVALLIDYKQHKQGLPSIDKVLTYYNGLAGDELSEFGASVLEVAALDAEKKEIKRAVSLYRRILTNHRGYYRKAQVKKKIGDIIFSENPTTVPAEYQEIFSMNPDHEVKKNIYLSVEKILADQFSDKVPDAVDRILSSGNILKNELYYYLLYLKAKNTKDLKSSNSIIDSYLGVLGKENYIYLSSRMLRATNNRLLGDVNASLDDLREFLDNYNPMFKINVKDEEMEKSFSFFENKAVEHARRGNLKDAAFHYFFNTQNMYLCRAKNLYNDTLYDKYSVYYQQKMVDSILAYSRNLAEKKNKKLLSKLNIISGEGISVLGGIQRLASELTGDSRLVASLGNLKNVNVLDPEGLDYIERHFKLKLPLAKPVLDYASVYGYAYYLISKSVILENFYKKTNTMTSSRKEMILRSFKIAEYELKWIIFSNPRYTDAYQLLGWLYQYIDIVKAGQMPFSDAIEGEHFLSIYKRYFPSGHFEENVDLYHQVIDFIGEDFSNKKVLSDLHLNLANNYYILNNYPKAFEQYKIIDVLGDSINKSVRFENFRQEGLFRFHYAKTAAFTGEYELAVTEFNKAISLYLENEYFLLQNGKSDLKSTTTMQQATARLALINALTGLALMEKGDYTRALEYLIQADDLNEQFVLKGVNLKNTIALCYMKTNQFHNARNKLNEANSIFQRDKEYFSTNDSNPGFFWNLAMPDEVRVIGEGRIPGAMSSEMQHLYTLGLSASIEIKKGNYTRALDFLATKSKLASKEKNVLGKLAHIRSLLTSAWLLYEKKDYRGSEEMYFQALKDSQSNGLILEKQTIFSNLLSLYANSEDEEWKSFRFLGIKKVLKIMENEYFSFLDSCVKEQKSESEDACASKFSTDWKSYDPLQGKAYYLLAKDVESPETKLQYLGKAWALLKNPAGLDANIVGLSVDLYSPQERLEMKLGMVAIQRELGETESVIKSLKDAEEFSQEFYLNEGLIESQLMLAQEYLRYQNLNQATYYTSQVGKMLQENPDLLAVLPKKLLKSYFQIKGNLSYLSGNVESFFRQDRMYQKSLLFANTISTGIEFTQGNVSGAFNSLQQGMRESIILRKSIQEKTYRRVSIVKDLIALNDIKEGIVKNLKNLQQSEFSYFFDPWDQNFRISTNVLFLKKYNGMFLGGLKSKSNFNFLQSPSLQGLLEKKILMQNTFILFPDSELSLTDLAIISNKRSNFILSSEPSLASRTIRPNVVDRSNESYYELDGAENPYQNGNIQLSELLSHHLPPDSEKISFRGKSNTLTLLNLHRIVYALGVDIAEFSSMDGTIIISPSGNILPIPDPDEAERAGNLRQAWISLSAKTRTETNAPSLFVDKLRMARLALAERKTFSEKFHIALLKEGDSSIRESAVYSDLIHSCYLGGFGRQCEGLEKKYMNRIEGDPRDALRQFLDCFHGLKSILFCEDKLIQDPFLSQLALVKIAIKNTDFNAAKKLLHAIKPLNPVEKERIRLVEEEIIRSAFLLMDEGALGKLDLSNKKNDEYTNRLYDVWEKWLRSGKVDGVSLFPVKRQGLRSDLDLLETQEKDLLFFLLKKAAQGEGGDGINELAELLRQKEYETGNILRSKAMALSWAEALFHRGDLNGAESWLQFSLGETQAKNERLENRIALLQFKLYQFGKGKKLGKESLDLVKNTYPITYRAWTNLNDSYLEILSRYLTEKGQMLVDDFSRSDMYDLISFLQKRSFAKNNSERFLDLAFARDQYRAMNERFTGHFVRFSDMKKPKVLTDLILKKMPKDQVFTALVDFGLVTYFIRLKEGKSYGDVLYKDNRDFHREINSYYREIEWGGNNELKKESIEEKFRKGIRLDNHVTYLYMPNIHFRTPLVQRNSDHFYFVFNPERMLERPVDKIAYAEAKGFNLHSIDFDTETVSKKMEKRELDWNHFVSGPDMTVLGEKIKIGKEIQIGNRQLIQYKKKIQGLWLIASQALGRSGNDDNLEISLRYLANNVTGLGVISLFSQNDFNNTEFIHEFTKIYPEKVPFQDRFINARNKTSSRYQYDREWSGYRMCTNSFIEN